MTEEIAKLHSFTVYVLCMYVRRAGGLAIKEWAVIKMAFMIFRDDMLLLCQELQFKILTWNHHNILNRVA